MSFSPSPTITNSLHFLRENKDNCSFCFSLPYIKSGQCVLSACLRREPPVLRDRKPLLHTSYCHCQREDTHTHIPTQSHTHYHGGPESFCKQVKSYKCCTETKCGIDNDNSQQAAATARGARWGQGPLFFASGETRMDTPISQQPWHTLTHTQ